MEIRKTAGYVRVSTSKQVETGTSLEDQENKIKNEAKIRGWGEPVIFKDEGISGKSTQRPALQLLLKNLKFENYHAIIFTKLDRLARNLRDILNFYHEAEKYGVKMICLDSPAISTDGPMGSVMIQVMGAFAQFERDLIRSRTVAGRMFKWKKGEAFMGRLPFGYFFNKETLTIEIDIQKEKIINKIYQLYIDNRLSMIDVAGRLTSDNVPTPSALAERKDASSHWNTNSVREILTNESYTGAPTSYNQYKYKWNKDNKIYKSEERKDKDEWITINLPKIIDKNQFDIAQAKILHNKVIPKKKHRGFENKFMAENFLRCGHCKAKMSKQTTGSKNFIYYTCPWKRASEKQLIVKNKNKCILPFLDSDKVDAAIFNQVVNLVTNPKEYVDEWLKDKPVEDLKEKVSALADKEKILTGKVAKAIKIEIGTDDPKIEKIYRQEREKIENEYQAISRQLATAQNELSFYDNKIKKLDQFKEIFLNKKWEHSMRIKIALKSALNKLSFDDKKKLVDAVISPETGGCVYVRELMPQDLGLPKESLSSETVKPVHGNKLGERNFVLELDFTLEPHRIIEIIQSMDRDVFKLGGQ